MEYFNFCCYAISGLTTSCLLVFFIFGGEFYIKINWSSWSDLMKHFKK